MSVFSGAGGLDLGAHRAGIEVATATDALAEAETSYRHLIPSISDFRRSPIAEVTSLPQADVLLGGYPCQPFSMGGPRRPRRDGRSELYLEFARCLAIVQPKFFVAENVPGLHALHKRALLATHLAKFAETSEGYTITYKVLRAEQYGVPQRRRRLIMVGVRRDLETYFHFPPATHSTDGHDGTKPFTPHGPAIAHLDPWPTGDFYQRVEDDAEAWPWYYMSRNRKARWDAPSYTVLANARHTPIHPGSPQMKLAWSQLNDGFKQGWEFSDEYDSPEGEPPLRLERPRRMSWQECSLVQGFPSDFEPAGNLMRKVELIGNAVPPDLAEAVCSALCDGSGLHAAPPAEGDGELWLPRDSSRMTGSASASRTSPKDGTQRPKATVSETEQRMRRELARDRKGYLLHHNLALGSWRATINFAYTRVKLAVFVDGCFWHGCPEHGGDPLDKAAYWSIKLRRNIERDQKIDQELGKRGWTVVRIWEHEDPVEAAALVVRTYKSLDETT